MQDFCYEFVDFHPSLNKKSKKTVFTGWIVLTMTMNVTFKCKQWGVQEVRLMFGILEFIKIIYDSGPQNKMNLCHWPGAERTDNPEIIHVN